MKVYSVTPTLRGLLEPSATELMSSAVRTCDEARWTGMLVAHNLHEVDPWLVAGQLGVLSDRLIPLVAVQPASIPPHTVAAIAASFACLYGRPLYFNLVAGAREDELKATGDCLSHDQRYERMLEYGRVLRALVNGERVDHQGQYYRYEGHRLSPRPEVLSQCKFFVAGSSPAGLRVALEIADVVVTHPEPIDEWRRAFLEPLRSAGYCGELGIRIGVIARAKRELAWTAALDRFPANRRGAMETALKTRSPNMWARRLADRAVGDADSRDDVYWLGAFKSGRVSAPFFVGDHEEVGARVGDYIREGVGHVLLSSSMSMYDHADINAALQYAE
jgi:alkanesulfonate monooxygenase